MGIDETEECKRRGDQNVVPNLQVHVETPSDGKPWGENAFDWLLRSRQQSCEEAAPKSSTDAAIAFCRPKRRGTGIHFVDVVLEHSMEKTLPVIGLYGASGTGKTWTLLTMAANFVASTRQSLFTQATEKSTPTVIIIDCTGRFFLPNLICAVRSALLRDNITDPDELSAEVATCIERIRVVLPEDACGLVPVLESIRCRLGDMTEFPTLLLWDGFLVDTMKPIARTEVIRQVSRLLKNSNVLLVTTSDECRRMGLGDKVITNRIQLEICTASQDHSGFVATVATGSRQRMPYNLTWGGVLT